jgi:hypothetical protein
LARRLEDAQRWAKGAASAHRHADAMLIAYVGGILLIGAVIVGGVIWGRSW